MKFTLKNRPKLQDRVPATHQEALKYIVENVEWFEGFERELREVEKLRAEKDCTTLGTQMYAIGYRDGAVKVAREILGE